MKKSFGVIALSSPLKAETVQQCLDNFAKCNVDITIFGELSKNHDDEKYLFSSDSIENRIKSIKKIKDVNLVLANRGGYGAIEILEKLKKVPDLYYSGYSDFTVFLNQSERLGFKAIHGMSFGSFATLEHQQLISFEKLIHLLEDNRIYYDGLKRIAGDEETSGFVFGGNLSVLTSLIGTKYFPDYKKKILFIEEIGERPYKVHRMLKQLEMAGIFKGIAGVILGDFTNCVHDFPPSIDEIFNDIFEKYEFPVYSGLSAGHCKLNLPIPFYLPAKLSSSLVFG